MSRTAKDAPAISPASDSRYWPHTDHHRGDCECRSCRRLTAMYAERYVDEERERRLAHLVRSSVRES